MAKLSKSTKTVIIAAGILLVLGVICLVLVMTTPEEEAPSEVSSVTSIEDTKTDLTVNEADDVLSLTVTNEHGKFTFERKERVVTSTDEEGNVSASNEYYWTSPEMNGLVPNNSSVRSFIGNMANLGTRSLVEQQTEDLDKYGLKTPVASASITFEDGTSAQLDFGIRNPAAESNVYVCLNGSTDVHQASWYNVSSVYEPINDFVNLTLTEGYNAEAPQELDYLIVERKDLEEPIEIRYMYDIAEETENEDSVVTTFNMHRFVSPITAEVDATMGQTVCFGVYALSASSCEYLSVDEEALAATGLDDPYCKVTFKFGGERRVLLLGDQIIATTQTADENTPELTTVAGYYGMLEGTNAIYAFSTASAPWYTFAVGDIMSRRPVSPYIYTIETLTVETPDGEYVFNVTGDSSEHAFSFGDQILEDSTFKAFYQHLITSVGEELFFSEEEYEPYVKVTFKYRDEYSTIYGGPQDVLEYYQSPDRKNIVRVNGTVLFKVRQVYTERLLSNLDALLNGGEVKLDW